MTYDAPSYLEAAALRALRCSGRDDCQHGRQSPEALLPRLLVVVSGSACAVSGAAGVVSAQLVQAGVLVPIDMARWVRDLVRADLEARSDVPPEHRELYELLQLAAKATRVDGSAPAPVSTADAALIWSVSARQALRRLRATATPVGRNAGGYLWPAMSE